MDLIEDPIAPRHLLQPAWEDTEGLVLAEPVLTIQIEPELLEKRLIVLPASLSHFEKHIAGLGEPIATIRVEQSKPQARDTPPAVDFEYDDDEAAPPQTTDDEIDVSYIPLRSDGHQLVCLVPSFENKLVYNKLARLVSLQGFESIVSVVTAHLPNDLTHNAIFRLGDPVPLEETIGVQGIGAALFNFDEQNTTVVWVVPAAGDFVSDNERVSKHVWPALAKRLGVQEAQDGVTDDDFSLYL